jgi:integrase
MATVGKYTTSRGETRYRARYRTPEGRQTDKRGFSTKRDAKLWASEVEVSMARGEYVSPALGKITVGDLGPAWLERHRYLKPSTVHTYEIAWRAHVAPRWSKTPIGKIRHSDVQAWVTDLGDTLSASRTANIHLVLLGILEDAVTDRMLAINPARNVKHQPRPPQRNTYLTAKQLSALAEASGRYGALVLLLGIGGLRWGEAVALRVCDVNFLRRRVHLHRNAVDVGGEVKLGTLKTNQNRTVSLPAFVIEAIAKTAEGKGQDDLLWPGPSGGYMPGRHGSWFAGAVRRCQRGDPAFPRLTPHDLRHTAASLAIHDGNNSKVVQRMLGHKSAAMTLDVYTGLSDSDMDAVAEKLGKMWARETGSH